MKALLSTVVLFLSLLGMNVSAQTEKPAENSENKVAQQERKQELPDFVSFFLFTTGYSNAVSLKTVGENRIFRAEGDRCYLEATFPLQNALSGNEKSWLIPAVAFARSPTDDTFCATGKQVPIFIHREVKKSFFGPTTYQVGEFNWGRFKGRFEIK